jgi:hypothetical protein
MHCDHELAGKLPAPLDGRYCVRRKNTVGFPGTMVMFTLVTDELPGTVTQLVLKPTLKELVCACKE